MNRIKTYLIHLLGGMTIKESIESDANSFMLAKATVSIAHLQYADSLNGMSADEWCKTMYDYLKSQVELLMNLNGNGEDKR